MQDEDTHENPGEPHVSAPPALKHFHKDIGGFPAKAAFSLDGAWVKVGRVSKAG